MNTMKVRLQEMFFIVLMMVVITQGFNRDDCENMMIEGDEMDFSGTWYIYAGEYQCENCCFMRNFKEIRPGLIRKLRFTRNHAQLPKFEILYAKKQPNSYIYIHESDPRIAQIVAADLNKTFFVLIANNAEVYVYTTKKDQNPNFLTTIKGLDKCAPNLYQYNPKKSCLNATLSIWNIFNSL